MKKLIFILCIFFFSGISAQVVDSLKDYKPLTGTSKTWFQLSSKSDYLLWDYRRERFSIVPNTIYRNILPIDTAEVIVSRVFGSGDTTQTMRGYYRLKGTLDFSDSSNADTTRHGILILPHFLTSSSPMEGQIGTFNGEIDIDSVAVSIKRIKVQSRYNRVDTIAYIADLDSLSNYRGYVTRAGNDTITGTKVFKWNGNDTIPNYIEFSKISVSFADSARFYFPQTAGNAAGSVWFDIGDGKFYGYNGVDTLMFGTTDSTSLINSDNTWLGANTFVETVTAKSLVLGDPGSQIGSITFYNNANSYYGSLVATGLTANRSWHLPDASDTLATQGYVSSSLYLATLNMENWVRSFVRDTSHTFAGNYDFGIAATLKLPSADQTGSPGFIWQDGDVIKYTDTSSDDFTLATTADIAGFGLLGSANAWTDYNTFERPVTVGKPNTGSGGINGGFTIYNATNALYTAFNFATPTTTSKTVTVPNETGTLALQGKDVSFDAGEYLTLPGYAGTTAGMIKYDGLSQKVYIVNNASADSALAYEGWVTDNFMSILSDVAPLNISPSYDLSLQYKSPLISVADTLTVDPAKVGFLANANTWAAINQFNSGLIFGSAGYLSLPNTPQTTTGRLWYRDSRVRYYNGSNALALVDSTDLATRVIGPATNTADYIPLWNGANSKTLKDGLAYTSAATAATIVGRDGSAHSAFNAITLGTASQYGQLTIYGTVKNTLITTQAATTDKWIELPNASGTVALQDWVTSQSYLTSEVDGSITNEIELPSQTGNNGKYLYTNGTSASWLAAPEPTWGDIGGTLSDQTDLNSALGGKQATLVSGTNIKTINSTSLLGSGNITVLTSESDPAYTSSSWYTTTNNSSNWDAAYSWVYSYGYTDYVRTGDSRLSDARTPTSHGNEAHSSTFLTANQTITLSGDVTGSGTTSITTSIAKGNIAGAAGSPISVSGGTNAVLGTGTSLSLAYNSNGLGASAGSLYIKASTGLGFSGGDLVIDYSGGQSASASTKGFLTATDWSTFNGKATASFGSTDASTVYVAPSSGAAATTLLTYVPITINGTTYNILVKP